MQTISFFSRSLLLISLLNTALPAMANGQRLENNLPNSPIKEILCAFDGADNDNTYHLWDEIGPLLTLTLTDGVKDSEVTLPVRFVAGFLNRCEQFFKESSERLITQAVAEAIVKNFGKYLQLQEDGTYVYQGPAYFDEATEDNDLVAKSFEEAWEEIVVTREIRTNTVFTLSVEQIKTTIKPELRTVYLPSFSAILRK